MKGYILNDDPRLSYTELALIEKGCLLYDSLKGSEPLDFILLGFNGLNKALMGAGNKYYCKLEESFFSSLPDKTIVYTGKSNQPLKTLQKKYKFKLVTLMEEEEIINQNAILTAEGLICELIRRRPYPIENSQIALIGYGHCGKVIAEKLQALKADVSIYDHHLEQQNEAKNQGFKLFDQKDLIDLNVHIIINTAPTEAISDDILKQLNPDTYLFDISSFPYGYHHECATHLHDIILPGLPSQYGYKEAGRILASYIYKRGITC